LFLIARSTTNAGHCGLLAPLFRRDVCTSCQFIKQLFWSVIMVNVTGGLVCPGCVNGWHWHSLRRRDGLSILAAIALIPSTLVTLYFWISCHSVHDVRLQAGHLQILSVS
jgi:hypothetical protein